MHPEGLRPRRAHPAPVAISRSRVCKATTRLQTIDAASSPTDPSAAVSSSIRDQERKSKSALLNTTTSWRKPSDKRTTTMTTRTGRRALVFVMVFGFLVTPGGGDLEPTFARCCALGANWARELLVCSAFPAPVPAISSEHQAICITAANVCCTRFYREKQCQEGMQAAQSGQDCPARTQTGGIFFKDCCDGCQLGLVSGSMGMGCSLRGFQFGFPWDNAYQHCCRSSSPIGTFPALDLIPTDQTLPSPFPTGPALPDVAGGSNALPPIYPEGATLSPEENLCLLFPGQLCGHVCVPTPGSFRCQCRAGFTLTADGKTCIQDSVTDRCQETNPCEHICMDTGVSIECSCRQGFQLGQDERSCTDIDECQLGIHACRPGEQVCYNQEGGYACINDDGRLTVPGRTSSTLDLQGTNSILPGSGSLGVQGFPGNTPARGGGRDLSFAVDGRCPAGYNFNLETRFCDDVDECLVSPGLCGRFYSCTNTIGSYTCTRLPFTDCPHGFTYDTSLQTCLDVDECAEETDGCDRAIEFCVNTHGAFECQPKGASSSDCPAGYKYNAILLTCEDVDECEEKLDGCDPEEVCRNTVGAYKCDMRCDQGFSFSLAFHACVDRDECLDSPCEPEAQCLNTPGTYLCHPAAVVTTVGSATVTTPAVCPAGFKHSAESSSGCQDVDECVEKLDACDPDNELCINEIGQYRCESIVNFNDVDFGVPNDVRPFGGGGGRGRDDHVPELPHATFARRNDTGSGCPDGFGYDYTTRQCLDVDECTAGVHNCTRGTERCINTLGSFTCTIIVARQCPPGYTGTLGNCQDIDECAGGVERCLPGQICVNTEGAFECRVECRDGFKYDPTDPAVCVDVDECLSASACSLGQLCVNTEGSYYCSSFIKTTTSTTTSTTRGTTTTVPPVTSTTTTTTEAPTTTSTPVPRTSCPPGYQEDYRTRSCRDIDECAEQRSNCRSRVEECVNTPGSFACRPHHCPAGYTREAATGQCVDVDECQEGTPCSSEEICVNTAGSYRCNATECQPGYERVQPDGPCQDINECEIGRHSCRGPREECVNTEGGHRCRVTAPCPTGFFRDPTSWRCVDVDECATGDHDCKGGERCINMYGEFLCRATPSSCTKGFRYNTTSRRCQDIDECAENSDSCDWSTQTCINSVGSFRCVSRVPTCTLGYRFDEEKRTCVDTDECDEGTDACASDQYCLNTLGSYQCQGAEEANQQCQPGYIFNRTARACMDIDECAEGKHDCWPNEICVNRRGTYVCRDEDDDDDDDEEQEQEREDPPREEPPQGRDKEEEERVEEESSRSRGGGFGGDGEVGGGIGGGVIGGGGRGRDRCNPGFRWHRRRRTCVDVDECAREDLHLCSPGEVCVNVHGGYECVPSPNTTLSSTLTTQTSPASTTTTTTTKVTPKKPEPTRAPTAPEGVTNASQGAGGPHTFTPPPLPPLPPPPAGCPDGFVYNLALRSCRDVDECETNPCDEDERCRNTQGSFSCDCRQGFHRDEQTGDCTDVNECQLGQHTCGRFQRCDNTIGSFTCIRVAGCGTGYTLNHNTGQCEDDDECRLGKDDCHQLGPKWRCVNTKGSFRCERKRCLPFQVLSLNGTCLNATCPAGYTFGPLGCIDINECEGRPCRRNERCLNNEGSYQCLALLDCSAGYRMNDRGTQCVDIDECQLGTHQCHGLQECINRHGGYVCQCPAGYRTNANRVCEDIDECNSYFGSVCSVNAKCENLPGSYRCNCKEGFKDSGDSRSCDDVDECEESSGICHHQCFNTWGSYRCSCDKGYRLGNDTRSCEDVDECSEYRGRGSLCIGLCINTPGSFKCDCPEGYTLAADGRTCQDINECESAGTCRGANELCVNTRGSHVCRELTCPAGYVRDSQHKNRCKKTSLLCRESDEECRRQPLSYSYNFLPLASNLSLPPAGNVDLFTMRGPLWTRTTVQFELDLDSARASPGVTEAARENFHLKRTGFNQAVISLVKPIEGPQEVELSLNMQLYHNGVYSGSAIAKLYIYVTQYEF
ncbi:uncharacterized protein LOC143022668 isoform X3 [Oratosquilla oratoria]|uniref:uncharacterized protein LOC143022668 isoform X3 n=1 Tax=Oratosquilla oratoria TaxID=337810 RepID=UPI003F76E959